MIRIIRATLSHRVAATLLLILMMSSGLYVIDRIEVRFFPAYSNQTLSVQTVMRRTSAENINESVVVPLENQLRHIPNLKKMTSVAREGVAVIYLEFPENIATRQAMRDTRRYLDLAVPNLPVASEAPKIKTSSRHENIMRLSLSGASLEQLRRLARQLQQQIIALNVAEVEVQGLPTQHLDIYIDQLKLRELNLSLRQVGEQIRAQNINTTAADIAGSYTLRADNRRQTARHLADLTLTDANGKLVRLGQIATIKRTIDENETPYAVYFNGKPAVEFILKQRAGANLLDSAATIQTWLDKMQKSLPANIALTPHNQRWQAVESRIDLLLNNGMQGLALVLLILFLLMRFSVAFWVAMGIPATLMVALAFLYISGGSLNMLSLFAFIMVTGLVVDDAIVVAENALYHYENNRSPKKSALRGVVEMMPAVITSTGTTIASFFPILIVGGVIGSIMQAIPTVVICVLIASLFECFCVLPGHFYHSLARARQQVAAAPKNLASHLDKLRDKYFRPTLLLALRYRWLTVATAVFILFLSITLVISGALRYRFFPGAELSRISVNAVFVAGTPTAAIASYMEQIAAAAAHTQTQLTPNKQLLQHVSIYLGSGGRRDGGKEYARLVAELVPPAERQVTTREFVREWKKHVQKSSQINNLSFRESRGGPAGEDLEIRLIGQDSDTLKAAANALKADLLKIKGISNPNDDMPYGKQQIVFTTNQQAHLLNLSTADISRQVRHAVDGYAIQTIYEGLDKNQLHLKLSAASQPIDETNLGDILIQSRQGQSLPLRDLVQLQARQGFSNITRINGAPVINVVADLDFNQTDVATAFDSIEQNSLRPLANQYGIQYTFAGSQEDQAQTTRDMQHGLILTLIFIYLLLAAVFSSWSLPVVIILTMPFGVIGAMFGHWAMGYDLSILSAFGLFALNGVIVNDSIILVRDYQTRLQKSGAGQAITTLIADSCCRRLRPILLTSLTTIAGLVPLIFETSIQAQFLIPMAISIAFGLGFATFLILYLTPILLSFHHSLFARSAA